MQAKNWSPFKFQEDAWQAYMDGQSGLVNAPTGVGKTFSLYLPVLMEWINQHPDDWQFKKKNGLQLLWITPLRALSKDLKRAMEEVCDAISLPWQIGVRTGDTGAAEKKQQRQQLPEVLIITPESLHLLLSQSGYANLLHTVQAVVIDEWHELLGTKRGVQVELACSRLKAIRRDKNQVFRLWAISATIGNLEEAMQVALGNNYKDGICIKAQLKKNIEVASILPETIEKFPWAGHLGLKMVEHVLPIIKQSRTTLLFTNTRSQSELWYHALLDAEPDLAGCIALHHGSVAAETRAWIEGALHDEILKVVVCTSSLDLGVDFRPVDTVIQVGSPKGVARFVQRAGRSGHAPNALSRIYFLPTHSLELAEAAALKTAVRNGIMEQRQRVVAAYDVLVQYLCTLAAGDGFCADQLYQEVSATYAYHQLSIEDWQQVLHIITQGGAALQQYDDYKKVMLNNGVYRMANRKVAFRHRLTMGTIVGDVMIQVRFLKGGYIGSVEESFIARLQPGSVFSLGGRHLEYVMLKDMQVLVRKAKPGKAVVPSWSGGRMPLSANLGEVLRTTFQTAFSKEKREPEITFLLPLFRLQQERSHVPAEQELLIEYIETDDGHHLFVYPFEGRLVHEIMAALVAYRISRIKPITFSIAMNDYGFELLSDQPIPVHELPLATLFSSHHLMEDMQRSINSTEMARRKFRDIAVISGLIFRGYPGAGVKNKHLQANSSLLFNVFSEFEPHHLLLRQSFHEAFNDQMEEVRLRQALERIRQSSIIIKYPKQLTPFAFPIKVDSLRETLTSEALADRVKKMQQQSQ